LVAYVPSTTTTTAGSDSPEIPPAIGSLDYEDPNQVAKHHLLVISSDVNDSPGGAATVALFNTGPYWEHHMVRGLHVNIYRSKQGASPTQTMVVDHGVLVSIWSTGISSSDILKFVDNLRVAPLR
jgi:hypothetical protein